MTSEAGPATLAEALLRALPVAAFAIAADDTVLLANPAACALGIVRNDRLTLPTLAAGVRDCRRSGQEHTLALAVPPQAVPPLRRPRPGAEPLALRARLEPLGDGTVCAFLEDVTEERRVEAVRRDFVANVSHELKTPVGAIALLAETIEGASDDPVAVQHFARRMAAEATRLGSLVQELIDLSRLQGAEALPAPLPVSVDAVVAEAVERTRLAAETAGIRLAMVGQRGLTTLGDGRQLATAVSNLVANAVHYSPSGTGVVVGVRAARDEVTISVQDEGIGIARADQERIFERFYRADPARSRATGGTGLGLAIVKHVAQNHGGRVRVWSAEGAGSTFSLTLPRAPRPQDTATDEAGATNEGGSP
ncbi:MAG: sensor signal transduction histidine kinase [Mycobacterium sp.]|nr:sensor signal transduction histidine kinase [Mycobacterium sp.]MCW2743523.1 sensor signal transduction histidine kinase [Mycobacterium sp.]